MIVSEERAMEAEVALMAADFRAERHRAAPRTTYYGDFINFDGILCYIGECLLIGPIRNHIMLTRQFE